MLRKWLTSLLELIGLVLIVTGSWMFAPAAGLVLAGAACVAVGISLA